MRLHPERFPPLDTVNWIFDIDEEGILCWTGKSGSAKKGRTGASFSVRVGGQNYPVRYLGFARLWGFYPEFPLRARLDLGRPPVDNRPADWVEVPKDKDAPEATVPTARNHPDPSLAVARVIPRKMSNAPQEYRYVRQRMFKRVQGMMEEAGWQWTVQVKKELEVLAGEIRDGWTNKAPKQNRTVKGIPPLKGRAEDLLSSFIPPPPVNIHPLEAWHLKVDDGYDHTPEDGPSLSGRPHTLPPLPHQGLDPFKLPAPITSPPTKLDMVSVKALERLLGVACRLQKEFGGQYQGKAGALVKLSFGPLDGCWRAASRTQTKDGWKADLRESQPAALDAARTQGWLMEVETVVGRTLGYPQVMAVRRDILKRWQEHPPSPDALRACRAAWTDSPAPAIGGDLRKVSAASQAVLRLPQAESPAINVELVLDNLADEAVIGPLTTWQPPNRGGGATTGVAVRVERTTHGFSFSLRARPVRTEEPYRVLNTFRIPIRITAKKLNAMARRRIWSGNASSREKLLALAPAITTAIKERLQQEKDYYKPQQAK